MGCMHNGELSCLLTRLRNLLSRSKQQIQRPGQTTRKLLFYEAARPPTLRRWIHLGGRTVGAQAIGCNTPAAQERSGALCKFSSLLTMW